MLVRIVALLKSHGVEDIVVNTHHLHGQVDDWCAANDCRASYEPEILGTGGVLNPLRDWIGGDDFFLVNGDIVVEGIDELDWGELFGRGGSSDVIATCLVAEEGPRTIEVEPGSRYVTNWKSDDAGCPGTFTYCGFARLGPEILRYVEPTGFSSIVSAYEKAMADGLFVKAARADGLLWTDAGTIDSYIGINRDGDDNRSRRRSMRPGPGITSTSWARAEASACSSAATRARSSYTTTRRAPRTASTRRTPGSLPKGACLFRRSLRICRS